MVETIKELDAILGGERCGIAVVGIKDGVETLFVDSCNMIYCNRAGIPIGEIKGKDPRLFKRYHDDFIYGDFLVKMARGEADRVEFSWNRPDGRENKETMVVIPFTTNGEMFYLSISQHSLFAQITP
ncbi:hypothetical protein [Solidesulfovibrio sp.]